MKQQFEVNRKDLVKFMINDDIDGLAEYINNLVDDSYYYGFYNGYSDARYAYSNEENIYSER